MSSTSPQRVKESKYAFYPDATTRAYQERLRRGTTIKFADFLRASVALIASDPSLEATVFNMCGGGYIDEPFDPRAPFVPPMTAMSPTLTTEKVAERTLDEVQATTSDTAEAADVTDDGDGFW